MRSRFSLVVLILFLVGSSSISGAVSDKGRALESRISAMVTDVRDRMQLATTAEKWEVTTNSPEEGFTAIVVNRSDQTGLILLCSPDEDMEGVYSRSIGTVWSGDTDAMGSYYGQFDRIPVDFSWSDGVGEDDRPDWHKFADEDSEISGILTISDQEISNFSDRLEETTSVRVTVHTRPFTNNRTRTNFAWSNDAPVEGLVNCGQTQQDPDPPEAPPEGPTPTVSEERAELEWSFRYLGSQERNDDGGYVGLLEIRTGRERGLFQDPSWDLYLILHTQEVVHATAASASAKVDGSGWISAVPFHTRNESPDHHTVAPFIEQGFPNVSVLDLSGEPGQELIQAESTVEINYRASGAPVRTRLTFDLGEAVLARTRDPAPSSVDSGTSFNRQQTERLIGTWRFVYKIGRSEFSNTYGLDDVQEHASRPGDWIINGTDLYGGFVVAGYNSETETFTLFDTGVIIHRDFVFDFDSPNAVSGCYYQISAGTFSRSRCYDMTGIRTSASALVETSHTSQLPAIVQEERAVEEVRRLEGTPPLGEQSQ